MRWVSQKDHLSCVRGSMEREGDSDGGWLLLSSPFKLFLHTGHVSCCVATEQNANLFSFGHFSNKSFNKWAPYFSWASNGSATENNLKQMHFLLQFEGHLKTEDTAGLTL